MNKETNSRKPATLKPKNARAVVLQRRVMPTVEELNRNFATALEIRLHEEYQRGKVEGLRVAKLIRDWLTRQPDRIWQKQVREWADKEIANAERELTRTNFASVVSRTLPCALTGKAHRLERQNENQGTNFTSSGVEPTRFPN